MEILLATNNPGKRKEYIDLAKEHSKNTKFILPKELGIKSDPEENGKTYAENSLIKAQAIANFTNMVILADDAGIEIEALGSHFPGIYSHRYLETLNSLNQLAEKCADSKAKFHCSIVLLNYQNNPIICEGEIQGKIVNPKGKNGFGFDEIFELESGRTLAELSSEELEKGE